MSPLGPDGWTTFAARHVTTECQREVPRIDLQSICDVHGGAVRVRGMGGRRCSAAQAVAYF
jgi:hypothetical protein